MANKTYRVLLEKLGGVNATNFIGNEGELFFDPTNPTLRVGDGVTAGGQVVSGGGGVSGNISISGTDSEINFSANSSGDGLGASTIELVPDSNFIGNDQYLVIDPTAPSHIHIRAGGTQDSSQAILYFGGETSHFRVDSGQNPSVYVSANNFTWTFYEYGLMKFPILTWGEINASAEAGQRVFISDSTLEAIPANFGEIVTGGGANTVPVWSDGSYWRIG